MSPSPNSNSHVQNQTFQYTGTAQHSELGQLDLGQDTFTAWEHKLHQFGMVQHEINVSMAAPCISRVVDCPELLLAGARLSLAGVSHSALGDRRQGTLLPTLIRQYHSRKSVSFLKVSGFLWSCMSSYFLSCFSTYLKGATCPD